MIFISYGDYDFHICSGASLQESASELGPGGGSDLFGRENDEHPGRSMDHAGRA